MRTKEVEYKDLGLGDESKNRRQLITAMVEHPRLTERPVVISGDRAVLGRPTEKLLALI
jgi:arsenate reductase